MLDPFSPSQPLTWPRVVIAQTRAKGEAIGALRFAEDHYGRDARESLILRAPVDPIDGTELARASNRATTEIVALAARRGGFEQMLGTMRRVPFGTATAAELVGPAVSWVGSASPKPVSEVALQTIAALTPLKISGIVVLTEELARLANAEQSLAQSIARALALMEDETFFGTAAGVANVSPAGVFYNSPTIASSGDPVGDAAALLEVFDGDPATSFWVMSGGVAASLALRGAAFQDVSTRAGGVLAGIPVVISSGIEHDTSGGNFGIVDAAAIVVAAGDITVDVSGEAALQLDSAPTSPPVAATILISLFQHDLIGLKVERVLNWSKSRDDAAALVTGASYGSGS